MFKSILVPVDLASAASWRKPLALAAQLARESDGVVHVMTVVPDFGMSIVGGYFEEGFEKKALSDVTERLKAWIGEHVPEGVRAEPHVAHGAIYHEILRTAETLGCDAIVMSAHRPELRDYLLGPNAARVVRHAAQSVFVLRE